MEEIDKIIMEETEKSIKMKIIENKKIIQEQNKSENNNEVEFGF